MQKLDVKHLLFHTLAGLFFIWAVVYAILLYMELTTLFAHNDTGMARLLMLWAIMNFITGSALFFVIRLFKFKSGIYKAILYIYGVLCAGFAATAVLYLINT